MSYSLPLHCELSVQRPTTVDIYARTGSPITYRNYPGHSPVMENGDSNTTKTSVRERRDRETKRDRKTSKEGQIER